MSHRDRLLDAARDLVQERGYSKVSSRDLVAASNTNLASIGYHFGSKEALLQEAIGQLFDEWNLRIGRAALAAEGLTPLERVTASWRIMLEEFAEHRTLFVADIEAIAASERSEPLRERIAEHYVTARRMIAEVVVAALPGAADRELDAEAVAAFLVAVGDGLLIQHLVDPERAPTAERLDAALGAALTIALGMEEDR